MMITPLIKFTKLLVKKNFEKGIGSEVADFEI